MATVDLRPNSDDFNPGFSIIGGSPSFAAALSDNNDGTIVRWLGSYAQQNFIEGFGTYTLASNERCESIQAWARWQTPNPPSQIAGTMAWGAFGFYVFEGLPGFFVSGDNFFNWYGGAVRYSINNQEIDQNIINNLQMSISSSVNVITGFGSYSVQTAETLLRLTILTKPTISVTGPTGTNPGSTRRPTVAWTPTIGDGRAQKWYEIHVYNKGTNPSPVFGDTLGKVWDSGVVLSANVTAPIGATLGNGNYRAMVVTYKPFNTTGWASDAGYSDFTINGVPPAPTGVLPTTTQSTDLPTLAANIVQDTLAFPSRVKAEWQLATNNTFTVNSRSVIEPDTDYNTGSTTVPHTEPITGAAELFSGTWYLRARSVVEGGGVGTWSATQSFAVSHPGSATNLYPNGDVWLEYGTGDQTFSWDFTSPSSSDHQTAYQILIDVNSDGTNIVDTGKVTAGSSIDTAVVNVPSAYRDVQLRWRIRLWNRDDVAGPYSSAQIFRVADPPAINITSPTTTVNNPAPAFVWSFLTVGRSQVSYRVIITQAVGGALVHDSGMFLSSTVHTYTPPVPVLSNGGSYIVTVYVTDGSGLQGSDSQAFTAAWTPPASIGITTLDATYFDSLGYVRVTWSNVNIDPTWRAWRVYRKASTESAFTIVYETDIPTSLDFGDYSAAANTSYQYAVVQVAERFGTLIEGLKPSQTVVTGGDNYWLVHPDITLAHLSVQLEHVTDDNWTDEQERGELLLIGRGRHVDLGTHWGKRGTLTANFRDDHSGEPLPLLTAREKRLKLEALKEVSTLLILRTPFGDLFQVDPSEMTITRVPGIALKEHVSVALTYVEVGE